MLQTLQNVYDGGATGGDGNLTQSTQFVAGGNRITSFAYDFRDRRTSLTGQENLYLVYQYDNLNRQTYTIQRDTNASGVIIGQTLSVYDDRGRIYQTVTYQASPGSGLGSQSLTSNSWFDAAGNTVKQLPAGSQTFAKSSFDGIGRTTARYVGYYSGSGSEPYDEVGSVTTDNVIFEQSESLFDEASNVIQTTTRQRLHNATGGGMLTEPGGAQPQARVSYDAVWPDGIGRTVTSADYGTNADLPFTRPATAPASSATMLVSTVTYNSRGEAFESTDPAGTVAFSAYDDAGRQTQRIDNFVSGGTAPDQNRTTNITFNPDGNVQTLTALNSTTGDQVTSYAYGVSTPASDINSNSLLASVTYPDGRVVASEYNRQGQTAQKTDQNGTVHAYDYDLLGRMIRDRITAATSIDTACCGSSGRTKSAEWSTR